jgi:hypothetical protein
VNTNVRVNCFTCLSYAQCLPSRFQKEIIQAASCANVERIGLDDMRRVLVNIRAQDRVSEQEIKLIFEELGNANGEIDTARFQELM